MDRLAADPMMQDVDRSMTVAASYTDRSAVILIERHR